MEINECLVVAIVSCRSRTYLLREAGTLVWERSQYEAAEKIQTHYEIKTFMAPMNRRRDHENPPRATDAWSSCDTLKTKKTNSQMWVWTWHSTGKLGQSCNDQVKNQWTQGSRNAWGDSASWNWHLLGKLSTQLFRCIYHVGQSRNNFSILPGLQPTVRVDPQHLGFQHSKHLHHAFWSPSAWWSLDSLSYLESHSVQQINW